MSKSYERLLQRLDKPITSTEIDPQIAALQARFATIVEDSKKDILGHHSDEDEDDDIDEDDENNDLDEDNEDMMNMNEFGEGEEDYSSLFNQNGEGELDDDEIAKLTKNGSLRGDGFDDVDELPPDEEDDEINDINDNEALPTNQTKKTKSNKTKDTTTTSTTQSLYDQYFNTPLTPQQIQQLEAQSSFIQPQSDIIGLTLRSQVTESTLLKQIRYNNKYNPLGRSGTMNENNNEIEYPPRQSTLVKNIVLQCGTMIDRYNLTRAQQDFPNEDENDYDELIEYELSQLSSLQIGAQQLQIHSDRTSLQLSPLPILPPSDSKFPVDQYGDGLVVTPGKERIEIEKMEKNGTWKKTGYKKSQLVQLKSKSDKIPKMELKRSTPSFQTLGLKQRLIQHLTTQCLLTPTHYNALRNSYIQYSSNQTQYEFIQNRIKKSIEQNLISLSKDHGLSLPSYQNDIQNLYASLLSTYTDTFFAPPIPSPNQQIDWFLYRDVYLVHIINHLLFHRDRIIAHNEAIHRRSARTQEENFIKQLSLVTNVDERYKLLDQHLEELSAIMDDETKSPQEQQEAQARLAVLTHSHKTRVQIQHLQQQHVQLMKQQQRDNAMKNNNNNDNDKNDTTNQTGSTKGMKMTLKKKEKIALQQRQQSDYEFQQHMSSLKMSQARADLHVRTLDTTDSTDKYRDQGFTRPAILILAPSKLHAYTIVSRFLELLPPQQTKKIIGLEQFHEEFGDASGEKTMSTNRPLDYNLNFNGANDDCFRFGIQFKGNGLKLFSSLYNSDLIIASPLGLKLIVGNQGSQPHERKADFLSSIEICVIDQLHLISHQNIDHLSDVLQCLNGFPSQTQNIDFGRIKESFLNGHGRFHRQNIWLSGMFTPQLLYMYQTYCENKNGCLRLRPSEYPNVAPYFTLPPHSLKQTFYKIDLSLAIKTNNKNQINDETIFDRKLHLWWNDIWPRIKDWYQTEGNTVIFIPSSYDFVRIRNIMEEKFVDYCICSEYTDRRLIENYRTRIRKGEAKFILVSERFWVFNRSSFTGIKHIVWYGLPTMPQAYIDFINYIRIQTTVTTGQSLQKNNNQQHGLQSSTIKNLSSGNSSSLIKHMSNSIITTKQPTSFIIYSIQDAMALERIVGTDFARELLTSNENIHVLQ